MEQLYSEHTLKLPDGVEILYTDSGPPKSSDYTTLVVLHGTGFNGYGFVRLHAYTHKHNMRTILWNRREYYGSTPYNETELADMRVGRQSFLDHQALQMAWFLEHFVAHENTPRVSADRTTGGFVVMGWSAGVPPTLALVASPDAIAGSVYETIEPYLRSLVVYDPPFLVLGYPALDTEGVRDPFNDPGCTTLDQVFESFYEWAAGYYAHRGVETGDPAGLSFESRKDKRSSDQWTAEDKAKFYDKHAAIRCMIPLSVAQAAFGPQTHRALFDPHLVASHFPKVNVLFIAGKESTYYSVWAYMESVRRYEEAVSRGERVRRTTFRLVPQANHFIHYDAPELLMREIRDGCACVSK